MLFSSSFVWYIYLLYPWCLERRTRLQHLNQRRELGSLQTSLKFRSSVSTDAALSVCVSVMSNHE